MNIKKLTLRSPDFPEVLRTIPTAPKGLYYCGESLSKLLKRPRLTVVGSRAISAYGRQVTQELVEKLAEQGMVIVSGLALGVDGLAHRTALSAGGLAIAVLPGPLDRIVPTTNRRLAQDIVDKGGALISEYPPGTPPQKQNFIARNRLMAGLGQAVLITEAAEKSGSLHTARFALEQGKTVMAVPGNINQAGSIGTNNLIKAGAVPVTSYTDILHAMGLKAHQTHFKSVRGRNAHEQMVLDLILQGVNAGEQLLNKSNLSASEFSQVLTMLEIGGKIRPLGANQWSLC